MDAITSFEPGRGTSQPSPLLLAQRSLLSGVVTCDPEDEEVVLDATDLAEISGLSGA